MTSCYCAELLRIFKGYMIGGCIGLVACLAGLIVLWFKGRRGK